MDIYKQITDRILVALKQGTPPWRKPWGDNGMSLSLPMNTRTKRCYNGINTILLWQSQNDKHYNSPLWGTTKTWKRLGATVKEAEKSVFIYCCNRVCEVFNSQQTNYIPPVVQHTCPSADTVIEHAGVRVLYEGNKAYYDIDNDIVHMPERTAFRTIQGFYTTLLHEAGHWTGHSRRLNRPFGNNMQDKVYAFEELIAELAACFLASRLNVPEALNEMPNHASYLREWQYILQDDAYAIIRAATSAQRATTYLISASEKIIRQAS